MIHTGITIEKDMKGRARYARIDLRKHGANLNDFFKENGVLLEKTQFTAKLEESLEQAKNGEYKVGNIDNLWD